MLTDENLLDLWDENSQRALFPFFFPFTAEIRRAPRTIVQHGKQPLDIDIQGCGNGKGRATTVRRGEAGTCPHGQIELNLHTCMCDACRTLKVAHGGFPTDDEWAGLNVPNRNRLFNPEVSPTVPILGTLLEVYTVHLFSSTS